jgi:hypothetical protein
MVRVSRSPIVTGSVRSIVSRKLNNANAHSCTLDSHNTGVLSEVNAGSGVGQYR